MHLLPLTVALAERIAPWFDDARIQQFPGPRYWMDDELQRALRPMPQSHATRKRKPVPADRNAIRNFTELPNVGAATAGDFRVLGLTSPQQLIGRDPFAMYEELCRRTNVRHDPCCIDVFMAAVDFMSGAPARPWWKYTPERKRLLATASATDSSPRTPRASP